MDAAGRWALIRRPALEGGSIATADTVVGTRVAAADRAASTAAARLHARIEDDETIEHVARTLLRRWGVVFWRLLAREADWLPPWARSAHVLPPASKHGARSAVGRFIAGFTGEQYAAPEAIGLLRDMRRKPNSQSYVSLSAADPLNLVGIVTPGARLPALSSNRVLYRDGVPIALLAGGEVRFLEQLEPKEQWEAQNLLLRRHVPAILADLA